MKYKITFKLTDKLATPLSSHFAHRAIFVEGDETIRIYANKYYYWDNDRKGDITRRYEVKDYKEVMVDEFFKEIDILPNIGGIERI